MSGILDDVVKVADKHGTEQQSFISQYIEALVGYSSHNYIHVVVILCVALVVLVGDRYIKRHLHVKYMEHDLNFSALVPFLNVLKVFVLITLALMMLDEAGFRVNSLLAFFTILGLGLSFSLKSFVSDFISGLMILLHRLLKVDDTIYYQKEPLRVTGMRLFFLSAESFSGEDYYIPYSKILDGSIEVRTPDKHVRVDSKIVLDFDTDPQTFIDAAYNLFNSGGFFLKDCHARIKLDQVTSLGYEFSIYTHIENSVKGYDGFSSFMLALDKEIKDLGYQYANSNTYLQEGKNKAISGRGSSKQKDDSPKKANNSTGIKTKKHK